MGPVVDPDSLGTNVVGEPSLSELDTRLYAYRIMFTEYILHTPHDIHARLVWSSGIYGELGGDRCP
jgi:hypothetical protein